MDEEFLTSLCTLEWREIIRRPWRESEYLYMRSLFVRSSGMSCIGINKRISSYQKSYVTFLDRHLLEEDYNVIRELSCTGGYARLPYALDPVDCLELKQFLDKVARTNGPSTRQMISAWPQLRNFKVVNSILTSARIKAIADRYLGCNSLINLIVAWRTEWLPRNKVNMDSDAMMFHFDCDHNRFLKLFVYLDDVDETCGPHVFIPRTSAEYRNELPAVFQRDGRILSSDLLNYGYEPVVYTGSVGSCFFADTHNLHKGTPVQMERHRYILQIQFVDSAFGQKILYSENELSEINALASLD